MNITTTSGVTTRPRRSSFRTALSSVVVALLAVTGVAASAAPANAIAGALSGYVTGADTHVGLSNIHLEVYNTVTHVSQYATSDVNGFYQFDTVDSTGPYIIHLDARYASGYYASEFYGSTLLPSQATVINLSTTASSFLSMELQKAGYISGHVTFSGAAHDVTVRLYAYNSGTSTWDEVGISGTNNDGDWGVSDYLPGTYKVGFTDDDASPIYASQYYNGAATIDSADQVVIVAQDFTHNVDAHLVTPVAAVTVDRIAGNDRFQTSALIAQEFNTADVVFVANGMGFPDALSAAPAAAFLNAPLLLTQRDSLPAAVKAQIERLNPLTIFVVGGTGVISDTVFDELAPLGSQIFRLSGGNRYDTSSQVFTTVWEGADALTAFLADGRNFPDALSSASAAASVYGPVILVNGASASIPSGLGGNLATFNTTDIIIAGGPSVVSGGIASTADALSGIAVNRYFGGDRYSTSTVINSHFFTHETTVYLAVGTGFADALAGAALAGGQGAPLYLVKSNCVPQAVLDAIVSLGANHVVLLGGTGVLSPAVESLTSCTPTTY